MAPKKKLIFTSCGLNTVIGRKLIGAEFEKESDIGEKRIFLFHEPYLSAEPILIRACMQMGFRQENIILSGQQKSNEELMEVDYLYCGEGNVFEIVSLLRERGLDIAMKKAFRQGKCNCFVGASAGAVLAGVSIEEGDAYDRNEVGLKDMRGLALFNGIILPHYTKAEAKKYIKNTPGIEKKYNVIYSVANDKSLILEI